MATLFQRMIGGIPEGDPEKRVPIYGIAELLREYHRGAITPQTIINAYNLTVSQQADLQTINQRINAASNKQRYFEFVFSLLALGELATRGNTNGALDAYKTEATFWSRVNAQG